MVGVAQTYSLDWRKPGVFDSLDIQRALKWAFWKDFGSRAYGYQPFRIYGDDIIVDKALTSNVIECLSKLGFVVNKEKSFYAEDAYRESCGKHYLVGEDVTPFYCKTKPMTERLKIDALVNLIDHANRALQYGYLHLRKFLVQEALYRPIHGVVQRDGMNPILFTEDRDQSCAIFTDRVKNSHLKKRVYDPQKPSEDTRYLYQRDEVCSITVKPGVRWDNSDLEEYHYLVWWRSRYRDRGSPLELPGEVTKADSLGTRAGWRWTAA
jgi:hypothetical protein